MHELHFHEDDVGLIQIMALANWRYCEHHLVALDRHGREHAAPDGVGWTKLYRFDEGPEPVIDTVALRSLGITEARFVELLSSFGNRFDRLVSPLSEVDEQHGIRSVGFGPSRSAGIIADLDGDLVVSIWCRLPRYPHAENGVLADMLSALASEHPLLLVDWETLRLVDLRSREDVEAYLEGER